MDNRPENTPCTWNRGFWLPPKPRPNEALKRPSSTPSDSPPVIPDRSSSIHTTHPTSAA